MSKNKSNINSLEKARMVIFQLEKISKENSLDMTSSRNCFLMLKELDEFSQNFGHQVVNPYIEQLMKQNGLLNQDGTLNSFAKEAITVEVLEQATFSPFAFEISFDISGLWSWFYTDDIE